MQSHNHPPHIHCTGHRKMYLKGFKSFIEHSLRCLQYLAFLHSGCVQTIAPCFVKENGSMTLS